jgi:hypothetical protein
MRFILVNGRTPCPQSPLRDGQSADRGSTVALAGSLAGELRSLANVRRQQRPQVERHPAGW